MTAVQTEIDLRATRHLHKQLCARWEDDAEDFVLARMQATEKLAQRGIRFESEGRLAIELSALLLQPRDVAYLRDIAETLHRLVERTIDWLVASTDRLETFFPAHRRLFDYLVKTPGLETWQGYSRYDAVLTSDGHVKIIELNTGCPAGLTGWSTIISQIVREAIEQLGIEIDPALRGYGSIPVDALVDGLLEMERQACQPPELVAVLNDENQLTHQLQSIVEAFRQRGRDAQVFDAAELQMRDGYASWKGRRVSLTLNKMRISTENSPNHHWASGFRERYAGFLEMIRSQVAVSVNNVAAMSIAEDKSLLAVLFDPEVQTLFDDAEREFLHDHVVPTARLDLDAAPWGRETVQPRSAALEQQETLVVKPANEGRGFGVAIGKYCSAERWQKHCTAIADMPLVIQPYIEPTTMSVVTQRGVSAEAIPMYVSLGLGLIGGRYCGLMSKVSTDPVTNVARGGMVQAVLA